MAVRQMRYFPDPVLRAKAIRVKDVNDPVIQQLIDDMIESMHFYQGVGIAANQLGSRHRICIIQRPEDEEPFVLINPEVTRRDGEREVTEGCLSLLQHQGEILRSEQVWAKAIDRYGKPVRFKAATDLLAQALEHETDHLNGKAYTDHLRSPGDLYEVKSEDELTEDEALEPDIRPDS
jgi:peptide deformylase